MGGVERRVKEGDAEGLRSKVRDGDRRDWGLPRRV